MKNLKFAFVDLETTGLNPLKHEILEIGVVISRQTKNKELPLEEVDAFAIQVKPLHIELADPQALRVNKYHERDWKGAVPLAEALASLSVKIKGTVFVAQNVCFDYLFLWQAYQQVGLSFEQVVHYHKLDLASMGIGAKYWDDDSDRFTLKELALLTDVHNPDAHTALSDARTSFLIANKLLTHGKFQEGLFS